MRRAFTILEALLAVAIGAMVCVVAYAGLRASAQAVVVGERLAVENRLLRAAIARALDELDGWEGFDPTDPAAPHPLRQPGQPFAPLAFGGADLPAPGTPAAEFACDLDQSKPHGWYRGPTVTVGDAVPEEPELQGVDETWFGRWDLFARDGHPDPDHAWHDRWLKGSPVGVAPTAAGTHGVIDALGYYGAFDYSPCNTICVYRDDSGHVPREFHACGWGPYSLYVDGGNKWGAPRDWSAVQNLNVIAATNAPEFLPGGARSVFPRYNWTGWADPAAGANPLIPWTSTAMYERGGEALSPLPVRPATWPDPSLVIRRYFAGFRACDTVRLQVASPITGETIKLRFAWTGSTLRGARRARGLDTYAAAP